MNMEFWMAKAATLAARAAQLGEVPVGALIVKNNELISYGYNKRERLHSPLAHAEAIAIQRASQKLKNWRLEDCTLFVTLEPCLMCSGAILQSRIPKVVYGCADPKGGAVRSLYTTLEDERLNHRCEVIGGVLETKCSQQLKEFFKELRLKKKESL